MKMMMKMRTKKRMKENMKKKMRKKMRKNMRKKMNKKMKKMKKMKKKMNKKMKKNSSLITHHSCILSSSAHDSNGINVVVTVTDGSSGTTLGVGGTGTSGSGCYVNSNWVDTGVAQANVLFGCYGGAACTFLYDVRFSCSAGT